MGSGVPVDGRKYLTACSIYGIINTNRRRSEMPKRAGRPAKAASDKRDVIFRFVVTKAEEKRLRAKAKASGLSISEYLRSVAIPKE